MRPFWQGPHFFRREQINLPGIIEKLCAAKPRATAQKACAACGLGHALFQHRAHRIFQRVMAGAEMARLHLAHLGGVWLHSSVA